MALTAGQIVNGRYRIIDLLGQGGFGAVYRAWDASLNIECALKENLDTSSAAQRQFTREASLLASLRHPNLPRVTDYFFLADQGQYLVMDFIEGQDLQEKLDRRSGALPVPQVLTWIEQVCDALSYLHAQEPAIIHRDIKPANIRITPQGQAMLVDFGIAKIYDSHLKTSMGAQAVTPGFSPPEQYGGLGVTDGRSDIYSLGATLYALVTGQQPEESVLRSGGGRLLPPENLNPALSPHLAAVIRQAMEMSPERRFQDTAALKAALSAPARRARLSLPHISLPRQLSWANPGLLAGVGIGVFLLLLAAVFLRLPSRTPVAPPTGTSAEQATTLPVVGSFVTLTHTPVSATAAPVASAVVTAAPSPSSDLPVISYAVQTGDTCTDIAVSFGVSVEALIKLNNLSNDCRIQVGQTLAIQPSGRPGVSGTITPLQPVDVQAAALDGMELVLVPQGSFIMGAQEGDWAAGEEEGPRHEVSLDAFWIDRTEVTNAMYTLCVDADVCPVPKQKKSSTRALYYNDPMYANYPVINIPWSAADAYCRWAGRRLPTEAEWEKAARGKDGRIYPWGDSAPAPGQALLNFNGWLGDTARVGNFPNGASVYGAWDMAGNVWEWVADWYSDSYYSVSQVLNPTGPEQGDFRALRGGSWNSSLDFVRTTARFRRLPDDIADTIGFRCAVSYSDFSLRLPPLAAVER